MRGWAFRSPMQHRCYTAPGADFENFTIFVNLLKWTHSTRSARRLRHATLNLQKRSRFVDGAAAGVIARATRADKMSWRDESRFLLGILLTGSKERWEL